MGTLDEKITGKLNQVKGAVKEVAAEVTNDVQLEAEGKIDKIKGKIQEGAADLKDAAKDLIDKI